MSAPGRAMGGDLPVLYFDGRQPRARPVRLSVQGRHLRLQGDDGWALEVDAAQVRWPERARHGQRLAHLPDGGLLSSDDGPAWDAWARRQALPEAPVVGWMQSWRAVGVALVLCLAVLAGAWRWGVPLATDALVATVPAEWEARLGRSVLRAFDGNGLAPSALPPARQAELRDALAAALQTADRADRLAPVPWTLHFRAAGRSGLGVNAFALPGGDLVVTDELVAMLADQPQAITGVLAHEVGHVRHRHGLRLVVRSGLLGALAGLVLGDFSSVLAAAPALLAQQAYSRDFEREADREALRVLRANRVSPTVMRVFFERAREAHRQDGGADELPIAVASHPGDEERLRLFSD